ncbi:MAG: methyltransferase domain-containing protein [Cellulosilyticum sp.]|nr:methyltransferase domain-containing protein [Cellulosilyticum sp.]
MLDSKKIGRFIANKRRELGLTQQQVANALHVSYQAVSKWEQGSTYPNVELLLELSNVLQVSVDTLLSANEKEEESMDEVYEFYSGGAELGRLERGLGRIEFERSKELIMRHLPQKKCIIYDIGGGIGVYSAWLAKMGHEVHLLDFVKESIGYAKHHYKNQFIAEVCDARCLNRMDNSADVVLLMGPLYHLQNQTERKRVLEEAKRVLKKDGVLIVTGISKFSSTTWALSTYGKENNYLDDEVYREMIDRELKTGVHIRPEQYPYLISQSYFHTVKGLRDEMKGAGINVLHQYPIEGIIWFTPELNQKWEDDKSQKILLDIIRKTETEESTIGMSPHFMIVGKK